MLNKFVFLTGVRKNAIPASGLSNGQVGLDIYPPVAEEEAPWSFPHDTEDNELFSNVDV